MSDFTNEHYQPRKCECTHKDKKHVNGRGACTVRDCTCRLMKEKE